MDAIGSPVIISLLGVSLGGFAGVKEFALPFALRALVIVDAPAGFAVVDYFSNFHSVPFGAFLNHRKRPEGAKVSASGGGSKPPQNPLFTGQLLILAQK
jgi:hypothetical protein